MKRIVNIMISLVFFGLTTTSCLHSDLEELSNSSDKELTAVNYTYRFAYNDTIKKGTPNEEIQTGRICEVMFKKSSEAITENGMDGFRTTLTYDLNSILKAGPTGSVTKQMLFNQFETLISTDNLTKLWVYVTISDISTLTPLDGSPQLGTPGDFSVDRTYRVTAADKSSTDYIIQTVKGF